MTTISLESAFADVESGADRALRAATALVAQTKRLVKAAREGDLRKLQTAGRDLQEQAREACAQAEVASTAWAGAAPSESDMPSLLAAELRALARAAGLAVRDIDGALVAFPVIVRQSGASFRFNKRKVTSDKPLKDWLNEATETGESLVVDTYHGLTSDMCTRAGMRFAARADGEREFWRDRAPELLLDATERLGPERKFDAVIVDEGQDFHELWWTSLDAVFRDRQNPACYYVFFDPRQNLYVEHPSLPADLGVPYDLPVNCRNTVRIAEHCARLVDTPPRTKEGAPIGDEPQVFSAPGFSEALRDARRIVSAWTQPVTGQLRPSQIAILAPGLHEARWPELMGNIPLTKSFEKWRRNEAVLISSWARFKGLEADAVVVIESTGDGQSDSAAHRYVARSRAKHLLVIIEVRSAQHTTPTGA